MKKIQSILLAFLIAVMMMPTFAFAEGEQVAGPTSSETPATVEGPTSSEEIDIAAPTEEEPQITEDDIIDMMSYITINVGSTAKYIYAANPYIEPKPVKGISYDEENNTLYLSNYVNEKCQIIVNDMGEDFKISVQGENEIRNIVIFGGLYTKSMGLERDHIFDAGLAITGLGDLTINATRAAHHAVEIQASGAKAMLVIDPKTNVFAYSEKLLDQVFVAEGASEGPSIILPSGNSDVNVGLAYETAQTEAYMLEAEEYNKCEALDKEALPGEYAYMEWYELGKEEPNILFYVLEKDITDKPIAKPLTGVTKEDFNFDPDTMLFETVECYVVGDKAHSVELYKLEDATKYGNMFFLTSNDIYKGKVYDVYEEVAVEGYDKPVLKLVEEHASALPEGWTAVPSSNFSHKAVLERDAFFNLNCLHNDVKTTIKKSSATYFAVGHTGEKVCADCGDIRVADTVIAKKVFAKPTLKAAKKSFTASWKKAAGATGYSIKWSTSKNMKNYKKKTVKAKYLKGTVKNLKAKKTYYVQVRAYKKVNGKYQYSNWSTVKAIKTK